MSITREERYALETQGVFRPIDVQFAEMILRLTGEAKMEELWLAAALASRAVGKGDICLDLDVWSGCSFPDRGDTRSEESPEAEEQATARVILLPTKENWLSVLQSEAARACVGKPGEQKPLMLDGSRLYLTRFWKYESQIVSKIKALAQSRASLEPLPEWFEEQLKTYFPEAEGSAAQRDAARNACSHRLALITGGPGTGKTHTVARIVALLAQMQKPGTLLKVRLAAPTGKAAMRVSESIRKAKESLQATLDPTLLGLIPETATTLHRLLGYIPDSPYFRHDQNNPLDADVVVVDEASMIDLPMMAKLLDALQMDHSRLILVGDRDQLASVEPGKVFGDIVQALENKPCMSWLTHSYRFGSNTAIGKLSQAINTAAQDDVAAASVWEQVRTLPADDTLRWLECVQGLRDGQGRPLEEFRKAILLGFKPFLDENKPEEIFKKLDQFRILCAVRNGPFGVKTINRMVEEILSLKGVDREHLHANYRPAHVLDPSPRGYDHQVILITVNDYTLDLFNGDVGVVLRDERTGELMAHFAGLSPEGTFLCRSFALNLLPTYETSFAMTIHKSQGSEFGKILLVLPPDPQSPLLTRELLYTGLTRTKGPVDLWCTEETFKIAVKTRIQRSSGLAERLVTKQKLLPS